MARSTSGTTSPEAIAPPEECALVLQAKDGDQEAFEKLYAHYNTPICRYLSRMVGNDGIGCELTQETFFKAWEALPRLREPAKFTSWLYRVATNCAYTYQKRTKHWQFIPWNILHDHVELLYTEGPESQIADTELLQLALSSVSRTYRPCLILYVIEELPQRQIASMLKIKESSVSKYVSRGKEELRQIYHRLTKEQEIISKRRQH